MKYSSSNVRGAASWAAGLVLVACGTDEDASTAPTWHQDVAPIVIEKCSGCHRPGGISPFALDDYASAEPFASQMAAAVEAGSMPPFLAQDTEACTPPLPWQDDLRLSDEEKATLRAWADADAPEGDPDSAAQLTEPTLLQELEREDVALTIPEEYVIDGTKDLHRCVILDPGFDEDVYVTGRLLTSGNDRVLHHVVSYVLAPGENEDGSPRTKAELEAVLRAEHGAGIGDYYDCFGGPSLSGVSASILDAWAPGGVPNMSPPNSGQPISKDALVMLDMHYHPTGAGPEKDSTTKLSLMLSDTAPRYVSRTSLIGNFDSTDEYGIGVGELLQQSGESRAEFMIPAGSSEHVEEMTWTWKFEESPGARLYVYGMGTHMHYVGRDMQITLEKANGDQQCLIQTPQWDFNWQRGYAYEFDDLDELPVMEKGDVLRMRCVFDNSMDNRFVREALRDQGLSEPVDVGLGEDTLDEMCLGALGIMYYNLNAD